MGGCWSTSDANDETEVKNKACHKRWEHNAPGVAEAIVLLELVEVQKEEEGTQKKEEHQLMLTIERHAIDQ